MWSLFVHFLVLTFLAAHQERPRLLQPPPPALSVYLAALGGNPVTPLADSRPVLHDDQQTDPALVAADDDAQAAKPAKAGEDGEAAKPEQPIYFPSRILDRPTVPVSAPDPRRFLTGTDLPALPIRLRLFVDTTGRVTKIDILPPEYIDPERIEPVKAMFMATRFIPGSIRGTRLPSYLDIEIMLSDFNR
ncbi:MAG: hypothetical protein FWC58_10855 [Desulfobulbus sp.]|nr:hypothetical protein [Desulfobulbus sp.]